MTARSGIANLFTAAHRRSASRSAERESVKGVESGKPVLLLPARFRQPRVALLIETSRSYGRDLLVGIARYVRAHRPWDIEFGESNPYDKLPRWFQLWEGDGVLARITTPQIANALAKRNIPVVDLYCGLPSLKVPSMRSDEAAVGRLAAEHLLARSLPHFAFCGFNGTEWSDQRRTSFQQSVAKAGFPCHVYENASSAFQASRINYEEHGGKHARRLERWLESLPKPIGIMACSDVRGREILNACRRLQLSVPDAVAVIGVDRDEVLCELAHIPLSSVILNSQRIGFEAAALLDRMMAGETAPRETILIEPTGVATRRSTDCFSVADPNLSKALVFIREHVYERINVNVVAAYAGVSRSVLQRRFRAIFHETVHDAIVRLRLKRACELLRLTDMSQMDVAEQSGFKHCEYMGAVFRTRVGKTPAQYRREFSTLGGDRLAQSR
ncbi:MAG: substrate-binding domain-containing protein [Limisphaerales bacterium]